MSVLTSKQKNIRLLIQLTISLCIACIFFIILHFRYKSDFYDHDKFLHEFIKEGGIPIPPLFYITLYCVESIFIGNNLISILIIMTVSVLIKYFQSRNYVFNSIDTKLTNLQFLFIEMVCCALLIMMPLYWGGYFYYTKFAPNMWHNSTTIFLMPFSLLLFFYSCKFLENPSLKIIYILLFSVFLNIIIKPSFFFCFAAVFPIFSLWRFKLNKSFWLSVLIVLFGGCFLIFEYYLIYKLNYMEAGNDKNSVLIKPFEMWTIANQSFLNMFLSSTLLPFVVSVIYYKQIKKNIIFLYTWSLFIVSILIAILFVESGSRLEDGNFLWQTVVCSYLLYLMLAKTTISEILKNGLQKKDYIAIFLFLYSVVSGIGYLYHYLINKNYD